MDEQSFWDNTFTTLIVSQITVEQAIRETNFALEARRKAFGNIQSEPAKV